MSCHRSTIEILLLLLDDVEIIAKELIQNTIAPKHQKISRVGRAALLDLLVAKAVEFKKILKLVSKQTKIERNISKLRAEVAVQDAEIQKLQKQLKEAEQILCTALFQARQKLTNIAKANKRHVELEELIKYAHCISASNAICAPSSWSQGDLLRPDPTDIEIHVGFIGKSDLSINGNAATHQNNINDVHRTTGGDVPTSAQNQFAWQLGELHMSMGSGSSVTLDTMSTMSTMSTDTSSSSSSDSQ